MGKKNKKRARQKAPKQPPALQPVLESDAAFLSRHKIKRDPPALRLDDPWPPVIYGLFIP